MKYDVALVIEDIWAFNPAEARAKASKLIKGKGWTEGDMDVFVHQMGDKRKKCSISKHKG